MRLARQLSWTVTLALATAMGPWHSAWAKDWAVAAGDWHTDDNWAPSGVPAPGEDITVSVTNAVISLTNETAPLGSFTMTAGRLVFSNWATRLIATNVTLAGGTVTVANAFSETEMSNRVWIVCSNDFTLTAPGRIDVSGLGYTAVNGPGKGTPATGGYGGGGGHGGRGGIGQNNGGPAYDNLMEPYAPGSGGGSTNLGGNGGGVARIEAAGTVTVKGLIVANGNVGPASYGGGGAGGTLCIVSGYFTGNTNGLLQANGANATTPSNGGGGGGGRIAVLGGAVSNPLPVRFSTAPGNGMYVSVAHDARQGGLADWGTVYIADTNLLGAMPQNNQFTKTVLQVGSATNWTVSQLTLTNNSFRLIPDGFLLSVLGDLTISSNAELGLRGSIECGGNLILTNNGLLTVYSGPTNAATSYGVLVNVVSNVLICGKNAWLRPHADPTNGGGVLLRMQNLAITQTNAGINACGRGYAGGRGPGRGADIANKYTGGGGYGGFGGKGSSSVGGTTNGNPYAPLSPGSGGGLNTQGNLDQGAGFGGGLIRVEASGQVTMEGQLLVDGAPGTGSAAYSGGGSGGGILITCRTFTGSSNALVSAAGGDCGHTLTGSGGGGRIAVWLGPPMPVPVIASLMAGTFPNRVVVTNQPATFEGTISSTNGLNGSSTPYATPGTVVFLQYMRPPIGASVMIR